MKRDPRKEPKVGDVLKDHYGQIVMVRPLGPGESRDLRAWQKLMKKAEVLHAAD